jgi:arylsulfatase A-like enzyme
MLAAIVSAAADKPNIVYILADDLGYGDLSCFGQKTLKTPNLDRMAAEGMKLTRHYAGSTVCAPSRCVLMTGVHTGHASVRGNGKSSLKPEDVTVAEVLKDNGYRTGCVGKWGIGHPPPLDDPQRNGFDYFYGYINMYHAHNFYPAFMVKNGKKVALRNEVPGKWANPPDREGRGVATKKVDYAPALITDEALSFIDRNRERPFFLYYALNIPHANNEGGKRGMEVPDHGEFADKDWPEPEKGFAAMIKIIDTDIGRVFAKLKEHGLDEKTLVIFSSDNGPHQEGGHLSDYFDSNGPYRGKKRDLFDGGVRVPTIARWPGKIAPGATSAHLSGFQDLLPTMCELVGAEPPPQTDGISLLPTLLGKQQTAQHEYLYWEFGERGGKVGLVKDNWKAIRRGTAKNPNAPIELYDQSKDPGEERNIAADHPELVDRLAKLMRKAHR